MGKLILEPYITLDDISLLLHSFSLHGFSSYFMRIRWDIKLDLGR